MKRILVLIASAIALLPLALVAAPASAATQYWWCNGTASLFCLYNNGTLGLYTEDFSHNSDTNFTGTNNTTWSGHPVWEYKQVGTNNCLTYDWASGNGTYMEHCNAGQPSQLWWLSNAHSLVNDYGTYKLGAQACLTNEWNGGPVDVETCNSSRPSQLWYENPN